MFSLFKIEKISWIKFLKHLFFNLEFKIFKAVKS